MHETFYQLTPLERRERLDALCMTAFCAGIAISAIIVIVAQLIMWVAS